MRLYDLPLTDIDEKTLNGLVDNEDYIENKWLEYKELPQNKDEARAILTDVAAMANTAGGDILLGIKERRDSQGRSTGIPEEITGHQIDNWDAFRRSWSQQIQQTIDTPIQGVEIESIPLASGRTVVIIRVPPSLQAPHMVTSRPCFYARGDGISNPMDIDTIRFAFLKTATLREQAEVFHQRQVQSVLAGSARVTMEQGPKVFLHVVPLGSQPFSVNVGNTDIQKELWKLPTLVLNDPSFSPRLNFDGYVKIVRGIPGKAVAYVQVFRNGTIEFCRTLVPFRPEKEAISPLIPARDLEASIVRCVDHSLALLERLNVHLPMVVFLTLTGIQGHIVYDDLRDFRPPDRVLLAPEQFQIDRDVLSPAGLLIESRDQKAGRSLKPIFDAIWNASGYRGSPYYNAQEDWE